MATGFYIRAPGGRRATNIYRSPCLSEMEAARMTGFAAVREAPLPVGKFGGCSRPLKRARYERKEEKRWQPSCR